MDLGRFDTGHRLDGFHWIVGGFSGTLFWTVSGHWFLKLGFGFLLDC